ncbi:HK97 gp10 family phage protein [Macrococcoides caseolyticum]|uniref:HK97 gp10 family phage protein n=1 Tax=Macrococcoides caseolyticum TaxID=69966 RepID=UPI00105BB6FA|nr:HK97 gp10 family phage protein [Macrococcus caseolyticus]TDM23322.1 HK97 gp10 family phage protein [Macrococcus caseolyticus]
MNSIVKGLKQFQKRVEADVKKGIAETTMTQFNESSTRAPVDTSALKNSIGYDFENGGYTGIVSVGAEHAKFIEWGTGIYAKGSGGSRAKTIPWSYQKYGKWYTTYGMPAQPFWYPSLHISRDYFNSYFNRK